MSKSKCTKHTILRPLLEVDMSEKCTAFRREAHVQVNMYKARHVQRTELACRKSARRCGAKHISKSKFAKHFSLGEFLEVEMSQKCTLLWHAANFQVEMHKTQHSPTTFGSWHVERVHTVPGQTYAKNVGGVCSSFHYKHHFSTLCNGTLHYTTPRSITKQYAMLHALHHTALHYTTPHHTPLQYTPLHYVQFHCATLHYTSYNYNIYNYKYNYICNYTTLHSIKLTTTTATAATTTTTTSTLHYTAPNYTTLRHTTLQYTNYNNIYNYICNNYKCTTLLYTTLAYTTLHYSTLHYPPLISPPQLQLQLHYPNYNTQFTPHHNYNSTMVQLQLPPHPPHNIQQTIVIIPEKHNAHHLSTHQ